MATLPLSADGRAYRDSLLALHACESGAAAAQGRAGRAAADTIFTAD